MLTPDAGVTETSKTTVDAYTELETAEKVYDRAKSFLYDNYAGELATLVTRNGIEINAGSYDVDIDATASVPFAFDGSKITIKASTYTGNFVTTGTITLLNGAEFIGTRTDTNGTVRVTSLTLTGLQTNSEVRVFSAGTLTEIGGVENSTASFTTLIENVDSVDIVIHSIGFEYQKVSGASTLENLTLPIQQRFDRNYSNP